MSVSNRRLLCARGIVFHGQDRATGQSQYLVRSAQIPQASTVWKWHGVPREPVACSKRCGLKYRISVPHTTGRRIKRPEPTTWRHRSRCCGSCSRIHLMGLIRAESPGVIAETYPPSKPVSFGTYSNAIGRNSQTAFSHRVSFVQ